MKALGSGGTIGRDIVMGLAFLLALATLQAGQETPPGQGGQSTPIVVRKEYDMRVLATPPSLSASDLAGRRLFVQRCGLCHDPVGQGRIQGPWLDRETFGASREATSRQMIEEGSRRMPGFRHALQPAQIDQIVSFLKTVTPDQRPRTGPR